MKITEYINKTNIYLPEYWEKDFSNHLPMAQYALYKIWAPEIKNINYENNFDFEDILEKNNKFLNDHNIKLAFTCYDEYNFYKKPIYKYIWNLI
jgi:hypothetical protein